MDRNHENYHLRNLILDPELCERVASWHGGQFTKCYALCSTGLHHLVSASMVDAAADELDGMTELADAEFKTSALSALTALRKAKAELDADRADLVSELRMFVAYSHEHETETDEPTPAPVRESKRDPADRLAELLWEGTLDGEAFDGDPADLDF